MIPVFIYANSPWDKYTFTTDKWQEWFRWRASLIVGWTPWIDPLLQWFNGPLGVYIDTYAIYNNNPPKPTDPAVTNPEWILKDSAGNKLYIPWGCANGTCPQYAADIRHLGFINSQVTGIQPVTKLGYSVLFFDDVNLELRIGDGNGNTVLPPEMTQESWASAFADLMEVFRNKFPKERIIHNSIWFSSAPQDSIDRQIKAADLINCERGFGDPNLNPTTFQQFMAFIDHVHSLKRSVIQEEYLKDNLSFKIACFLLMYESGDLMSVNDLYPDIWDTKMDVNFGEARGERYLVDSANTVYERMYSKVKVTVNFSAKTGTVATV